ncbi:response regulator transcription factor [Endozoicomonas sp. G2_1]|uniref:response regulator transcription factor n=1 Tax=Endozoicomonas sp. G2_1 TaxID=2821091 RepID=UPI001AD9F5C2|nr:response regulator transcription factor [Endozoicomonas sp. G2_1]MBO9491182.1 response regulator transcription factor [Endozoicomonas sp. G2_1]
MISVLVVEDQALVRGAICALLELSEQVKVVGQASDGIEALALLSQYSVDIVLTDIEMPKMTGIELVEKLAQQAPEIKSIIMTTFSRAGYIRRALNAGVKGFVLKEAPSEYLISAILKVAQGKKVIEPELAISALDDQDPLSDKERKALRLASDGIKTADIASQLFLSEGTVRNYLSEAIAKLNATNRIDAARIARDKGWL